MPVLFATQEAAPNLWTRPLWFE